MFEQDIDIEAGVTIHIACSSSLTFNKQLTAIGNETHQVKFPPDAPCYFGSLTVQSTSVMHHVYLEGTSSGVFLMENVDWKNVIIRNYTSSYAITKESTKFQTLAQVRFSNLSVFDGIGYDLSCGAVSITGGNVTIENSHLMSDCTALRAFPLKLGKPSTLETIVQNVFFQISESVNQTVIDGRVRLLKWNQSPQ